MQNNVVEVRIARMSMSVPIRGVDMQFDIAFINFSVYLDGRAGEVGALTKIPVSGINDFQILALPGFERRRAKQLVVPDAADDFFWNPDAVIFFPNLQLIVEMGISGRRRKKVQSFQFPLRAVCRILDEDSHFGQFVPAPVSFRPVFGLAC